MIEPHVVHGGASSWFCIAANALPLGFSGARTVTFGAAELGAGAL